MTSHPLLKLIILSTFFLWSHTMQAEVSQYLKINKIDGKPFVKSDLEGKTILFVNIATQCGYTPQLKGLESLYNKFKGQNFTIIGVPSNDFGGQTPEENKDVKKFCLLNYGVTFPLTEKVIVKGSKKHSVIEHLISQSKEKADIAWNFEKFLVNKNGQVVNRFSSSIKPDDETLLSEIEKILN